MADDTERPDPVAYGYPYEDLTDLLEASEARYMDNVDKHGPGKNWLDDEARWHIWKACDELFQARDCAHAERPYPTRKHMADALNHMLFALEITRNNCLDDTATDFDGVED